MKLFPYILGICLWTSLEFWPCFLHHLSCSIGLVVLLVALENCKIGAWLLCLRNIDILLVWNGGILICNLWRSSMWHAWGSVCTALSTSTMDTVQTRGVYFIEKRIYRSLRSSQIRNHHFSLVPNHNHSITFANDFICPNIIHLYSVSFISPFIFFHMCKERGIANLHCQCVFLYYNIKLQFLCSSWYFYVVSKLVNLVGSFGYQQIISNWRLEFSGLISVTNSWIGNNDFNPKSTEISDLQLWISLLLLLKNYFM